MNYENTKHTQSAFPNCTYRILVILFMATTLAFEK